MLLLLLASVRPPSPGKADPAVVLTQWLSSPDASARPAPQVAPDPKNRTRPRTSRAAQTTAPETRSAPVPVEPAEPPTAATVSTPNPAPTITLSGPAPDAARPPVPPASAPLRLDRSVLREANRASRSEVQRMADASGQRTGDPPRGAAARLAEGVTESAKPDCAPLSNPGGDLLLTPLLALAGKLTDRCK